MATVAQPTTDSASYVSPIDAIKLLDFTKSNNFVDYKPGELKTSEGGRYITLINKDNKALNVFFGKKAGEAIAESEEISGVKQIVDKSLLVKLSVWTVKNEAGEDRLKAFFTGAANRASLDDVYAYAKAIAIAPSMEALAALDL
jgi:hypothetical protein